MITFNRRDRAQMIWSILKSYMLDECSLDCAAISPADEKNLINEIFNSIPEESPSVIGGMGKSESLHAANLDFKQVFDFLESIGGAGYGGMAEFEIARETMRRTSTVARADGGGK